MSYGDEADAILDLYLRDTEAKHDLLSFLRKLGIREAASLRVYIAEPPGSKL